MEDELPTRPLNQPPSSTEPAGGVWLVSFGDDDDRELSVQQISEALGRGEIDPGTIVWRDGMSEWQPISQLSDLRAALKQFAVEASPRKKRTVLGGFAADASKLQISTRQTARIWSPGAPPTAAAPPAPAQVLAPAAPPAPTPDAKATGGLLNQGPRRRTLLGTGFKVPAAAKANKPAAEMNTSDERSDAAEPQTLELAREEPYAFPLNRRVETQTPTVPLPRVRSPQSPLADAGPADSEEEEPETQRPVNVGSRATPPPRRVERRPLPHSPGRPSRPPPARPPSRNPPAPLSEDAEPISLMPDSVESLPPDALDSVVANLPPLEAPSAPAILDVDVNRGSEIDVSLADSDVGSKDQRHAPHAHRAASIRQPARVTPDSHDADDSDAETRKAEELTATLPLSSPRETAGSESRGTGTLSESDERREASAPAELKSYDELALPSAAPKEGNIGKMLLAALLIGCGITVFLVSRGPSAPTQANIPVPVENQEAALPEREHAPTPPNSPTEPAADTVVEEPEPQPADQRVSPPPKVDRVDSPPPKVDRVDSPPARQAVPQTQPVAANEKEPAQKQVAPEPPSKPPPESPAIEGDPASVSQGPAGPFDKAAAVAALERAAGRAAACRKPGDPSGIARVNVTFASSGRATRAVVNGPPFAGTATGGCIASTMRGARVPKFKGDLITVTKKVVIQ